MTMRKTFIVFATIAFLLLPIFSFATGDFIIPQDGDYTIEATLTGGSGRAGIESPLLLTVKDRRMTANIVWSSPYFEWMKVDGIQYDSINTEGNAAFIVGVEQLDVDIPVAALTVAMSEPHEITYTLQFDSSTIKSEKDAASRAWIPIGALLVLIGIFVARIAWKKRKEVSK